MARLPCILHLALSLSLTLVSWQRELPWTSANEVLAQMVVKETANGLAECFETIEKHKEKSPVFILFSGDKDAAANSWCPDCVDAELVMMLCLSSAPEDSMFIYCSVGDKASWKDPENAFRINSKVKLTALPTLLKWGTAERLTGNECKNADLVKMLFEEEG